MRPVASKPRTATTPRALQATFSRGLNLSRQTKRHRVLKFPNLPDTRE